MHNWSSCSSAETIHTSVAVSSFYIYIYIYLYISLYIYISWDRVTRLSPLFFLTIQSHPMLDYFGIWFRFRGDIRKCITSLHCTWHRWDKVNVMPSVSCKKGQSDFKSYIRGMNNAPLKQQNSSFLMEVIYSKAKCFTLRCQ